MSDMNTLIPSNKQSKSFSTQELLKRSISHSNPQASNEYLKQEESFNRMIASPQTTAAYKG